MRNQHGLPGVSGRIVATSRETSPLDALERLITEPDAEAAPPRWWQRVLPILVALNAFALGAQYVQVVRLSHQVDAAREAQQKIDANLARSRALLESASACHSYWPEQDDAGQVSRL